MPGLPLRPQWLKIQREDLERSKMSLGHLGMPILWFVGDFRNVGFNEIIGFTGVSVCFVAVAVSWYQIRRDAQNQPR